MEQNVAVRMAHNLYEQKNYLAAVQASLELMKDPELAKEGHLIFAKAFIFLISHPNEEDKMESLSASIAVVAKRAKSLEELFDSEAEINEAFEEWKRELFVNAVRNLEENTSRDNWTTIINLPPLFLLAHLKFMPNSDS